MNNYGYNQGDMKAHVDDYQKPLSNFSQEGFGKTTKYVERQDSIQNKEAASLNKMSYKGRYS